MPRVLMLAITDPLARSRSKRQSKLFHYYWRSIIYKPLVVKSDRSVHIVAEVHLIILVFWLSKTKLMVLLHVQFGRPF